MIASSPTSRIVSSGDSRCAASQQPFRMAAGALSPPITSTAARTVTPPCPQQKLPVVSCQLPAGLLHWQLLTGNWQLFGLLLDLKRELRVHVPAVVAGTMGELGGAALGTAH